MLEAVSAQFRAAAEAFVPEVRRLDEEEYARLVQIVEGALADRPPGVRRQLLLFLRILDWLALPLHGRRLRHLDRERRAAFLRRLQDGPFLTARRGVWGLRTLVFMGYYGREAAREEVGYRAHPAGWEAASADGRRAGGPTDGSAR